MASPKFGQATDITVSLDGGGFEANNANIGIRNVVVFHNSSGSPCFVVSLNPTSFDSFPLPANGTHLAAVKLRPPQGPALVRFLVGSPQLQQEEHRLREEHKLHNAPVHKGGGPIPEGPGISTEHTIEMD